MNYGFLLPVWLLGGGFVAVVIALVSLGKKGRTGTGTTTTPTGR